MIAIITDAIEQKLLLEFQYDGGIRIVEPYCHGLSSKGNHVLRAFQVDGYSSSGQMGWKLYDMSKSSGLLVSGEAFSVIRPGYSRGDKGIITIYHEI